ncbi:cell division protein PerM [Micromonospora sp. NBC_01796]|uniref:cell division protein PerM n=1 Tax=Micromonospora sp. NBC_01796 TaxID=2975987 RepID=UPI002DD8332F|nr:DUF6350 family protein [Micromonospora sp. NBC_01796]WSA89739.1 DUF6350 family protein [Micromonospora sp. NBC_01796]
MLAGRTASTAGSRTARPDGPSPVPARRSGRAPLPVAAAVATGWAASLSYLPVAIILGFARFTEDAGAVGGAARVGMAGWLLGHGVPLETDAGTLHLPPLGLAVLAAWRVARAGVHTSRAIGARQHGTPRQAFSVAGAVGVAYGLLGVVAALIVNAGGQQVSPVRAGLTLTCFGALAALAGALPITGTLGALARRTPSVLRDGLRTGFVAALLLLGAGAGAAGLAVATGGGAASDMLAAYRTGVVGQAGITVVSVAYAPNASVWAASYLLGPGFAIGTDTSVSTTEVTVGALPAVPLLAGLPSGPIGGLRAALLAVPAIAGMAAGWLLTRRSLRRAGLPPSPAPMPRMSGRGRPAVRWAPLLAAAAIGGPVAGALLGLAAWASGGSLGGGRMAEVGPVSWQVSVIATVVLAVGAVVGAAVTRAFARP